jgi:guanylate kinase
LEIFGKSSISKALFARSELEISIMSTSRSGRKIIKPSRFNNFGFESESDEEEVVIREPSKKVSLE